MYVCLIVSVGMSFLGSAVSLHITHRDKSRNVTGEEDMVVMAGIPVYHVAQAWGETAARKDFSSIGIKDSSKESPTYWNAMFDPTITADALHKVCEMFPQCKYYGHMEKGHGIPYAHIFCTHDELNTTLHNLRDDESFENTLLEYIEYDFEIHPGELLRDFSGYLVDEDATAQAATWGLNAIGADSAPGDEGRGVHAYVMDTGVRCTHSQFAGRALPTIESLSHTSVHKCECGNTSCGGDAHGHGTHCAGTVAGKDYGVAPKTIIHAVKIIADNGYGYTSWTLNALDWIRNYGMKPGILSMSLGSTGKNNAEGSAIDLLIQDQFTVVVSAGNEAADACGFSPAWVTNAITVGSTTSVNAHSWFSNYGTCVDILAPGSSVISAGITSDTSTASKSGTSMACPHVSGAVALIMNMDHTITPAEALNRIMASAKHNLITGVPSQTPNIFLYTSNLTLSK